MKLSAVCCTYLRPESLGELIESYLRQDYPRDLRELVILDDAGQYTNQEGDGWRLVSVPRRFRTLGEKRNACAALASSDADALVVADDDDIYLPHWFSTHARALENADWSRPSIVYELCGEHLVEVTTDGLYHASWAFRRQAFDRVRGYANINNGEDQDLGHRFLQSGLRAYDPNEFAEPYFVRRLESDTYHVSFLDDVAFNQMRTKSTSTASIQIGWKRNYVNLLVRPKFGVGPAIGRLDGKYRVELIGPINSMENNGPSRGMHALQRGLQARIDGGLDWLSIKSLPVSEDALPWFWNWQDRSYANWWNKQGRPFLQGPNMLFLNSRTPRIDQEECGLLDASQCRAMFCHSSWYSELIRANKGVNNKAPVVTWPYPINPIPDGPLPAKHDLLIYCKSGFCEEVVSLLRELYASNVVFRYGSYDRDELLMTARQSRACVYLSDDDHGPLALQEILLSGCPTVGLPHGAPFIRPNVTGFFVNPEIFLTTNEPRRIGRLVQSIESARHLSRQSVRETTMFQFSPNCILDEIINCLDIVRCVSIQNHDLALELPTSWESTAKKSSNRHP